jgi:hypothetical protein
MNFRGCIFRVKLDNDSKVLTLKDVNDVVFVGNERIVSHIVECDTGSKNEAKEIGCEGGALELGPAGQLRIRLLAITFPPLAALHKALLRSRKAKDSHAEQDGIILLRMNPKRDVGGVIRYIPNYLFEREFFASSDANATQRDRVLQRPVGEISNHLRTLLLAFAYETPQWNADIRLAKSAPSYLFWKDPVFFARLPNPRAALSVAFSS